MPKPRYEVFKGGEGTPKLKYERGFVAAIRVLDNELMATEWAESPWHTLLREGKALAVELYPDQGGFVNAGEYPTHSQLPPFELMPALGEGQPSLDLGSYGLAGWGYEMADLAEHPILCRVTRLHLFEANLADDNLGVLARSPLLTQLREVSLGDCTISFDAMRALVTSPSIKQLRVLFMNPAYIAGGRRGRGVGQLWEIVASSPNMASLEHLWIDSLDNKGAAALIQSPYLKESLRLCPDPSGRLGRAWEKSALTGELSAANVNALRERYPGTPF